MTTQIVNLKTDIQNCQKCPLYLSMPETCHPVPGEGPLNAKCMMVCENLSEDDALLERPLMGLDGQFLDKVLKKLDIPRESCYITSAVKCRSRLTPPSTKEKKICADWLEQEIKLVSPKLIFTFGSWPTKLVLRRKSDFKLNDVLGQLRVIDGHFVVPCQSLRYILSRSQNDVRMLEETLKENYNAICRKA